MTVYLAGKVGGRDSREVQIKQNKQQNYPNDNLYLEENEGGASIWLTITI